MNRVAIEKKGSERKRSDCGAITRRAEADGHAVVELHRLARRGENSASRTNARAAAASYKGGGPDRRYPDRE